MSIAFVLSGSFRYRTESGDALLDPCAFLLGTAGRCYQCGHEHGRGVYATADASDPDYRGEIETFLRRCREDHGQDSHYLTGADCVDPMWEAEFESPTDMRERKAAQFRLVERRIAANARDGEVIDALLRKLNAVAAPTDLSRLSEKAGIPWRRWQAPGDVLSDQTQALVDEALRLDKAPALLQAVQMQFA